MPNIVYEVVCGSYGLSLASLYVCIYMSCAAAPEASLTGIDRKKSKALDFRIHHLCSVPSRSLSLKYMYPRVDLTRPIGFG